MGSVLAFSTSIAVSRAGLLALGLSRQAPRLGAIGIRHCAQQLIEAEGGCASEQTHQQEIEREFCSVGEGLAFRIRCQEATLGLRVPQHLRAQRQLLTLDCQRFIGPRRRRRPQSTFRATVATTDPTTGAVMARGKAWITGATREWRGPKFESQYAQTIKAATAMASRASPNQRDGCTDRRRGNTAEQRARHDGCGEELRRKAGQTHSSTDRGRLLRRAGPLLSVMAGARGSERSGDRPNGANNPRAKVLRMTFGCGGQRWAER